MTTCGNCGNEEPEGSRFCGTCGAPLAPAEQPVARIGRERHDDADLSELRQRGARGRAVLRELQRAVVAG